MKFHDFIDGPDSIYCVGPDDRGDDDCGICATNGGCDGNGDAHDD